MIIGPEVYRCPICGNDMTETILSDSRRDCLPDGGSINCSKCGSIFDVRYEWDIKLKGVYFAKGLTPMPVWAKQGG